MTAWINMLNDSEASDELSEVLTLARTPHGTVDNVMRVHSLRPATMRGHVVLYRAVLHDDSNTLPLWLQECIASWVSILNHCDYSLANHWANAHHLIGDESRAAKIHDALQAHKPGDAFDARETALFDYAQKLTVAPGDMCEADVEAVRAVGFDDGEILELNQIVCYFNYVNRSINGLGVTTENDTVGYYAGEQ
ncbi:MAG: peroxidase-related enzyme [Pseudomonadota bacterium]